MALQDILKKILSEADGEIEQIVAASKKEETVLEKDSAEVEEAELKALDINTESALESIEKKTRSMARREKSKIVSKAKQAIIESLLDKLQSKLEATDDVTYEKILVKLFEKISDTEGTVKVCKKRMDTTKKVAPKSVKIEVDESVAGGFVFQSATGIIDNSFKSLIHSEFRSELEIYFADQLKFI